MSAAATLAPPAEPWARLSTTPAAGAYLSVYLSSPYARLPVRDVTRLGDNKSDPNLETLTYGLFSTCEPIMRASIASHGIGKIFFLTNIEGAGRALVGLYELGWLVEVDDGDVALAATSARFIEPIPVARIAGQAGKAVQTRMRAFMRVDAPVAAELSALVESAPDRTADYLAEIDRLERMSRARTGFRYPSWDRKDPFSWADAEPYLSNLSSKTAAPNTSPSGAWICSHCQARIVNRAKLKVCNVCGRRGTLQPEPSGA
jgi:hypothetical protein